MFNRLSTPVKFYTLTVIIFVVLAVVLIFVSRLIIKDSFTHHAVTGVNADILLESKKLKPEDFSQKDPQHIKDVFNKIFEKIKTTEIVRIKVWDYSGRVIFSDDESIVGKRFPENDEFQKAIKGELLSNIEKSAKPENVSEKNYGQLLEIYVPIIFNGESIPSGVIEVYFGLDSVNAQINQAQVILLITIVTFAGTTFLIFLILFRLVVYKQVEKINMQASALDNASDHVIITDIEGVILYVNKAAEKLTGYTQTEMIGNRPSVWGKQMPKEFYEKMWNVIKVEKKEFAAEITNKRKNGEEYVADARITPVLDKNNKILFFIGIEHDITERRSAEAKILESNKRLVELEKAMANVMEDLEQSKVKIESEKVKYSSVLENIGEGVFAIDSERKVMLLNKMGEQLLGWKEKDLLGKVINNLPLENGEGQPILLENRPTYISITTGKSVSGDYIFVRPDKTKFSIGMVVAPIKLNDKIVGAIIVFRDVTKDKEIDRAKTEFVSLASHQLRTPLTSINWYIEMLQSGDGGVLNDKQKEYFLEIYKASRRMAVLLNDLLNVSRLETGRLKIETTPTDLKAFIREVCKEVEPLVLEMGCHLALKLPEKLEKVQVDQVLLRQVISNLLTNAIQYSSVKKAGQVSVSLTVSPKEYTINVKDNGIGIPKEIQGRIFEKFYRADNAQQVLADGNGLGLYLVKQIIDAFGGRIRFDSQLGKGSTFYVTIPVSGMKPKKG